MYCMYQYISCMHICTNTYYMHNSVCIFCTYAYRLGYIHLNAYRLGYIHSGENIFVLADILSCETGAIRVRGWIRIFIDGFSPRDTVRSKEKRASHKAQANTVPLQEERAGQTACHQFMAEHDFCTWKNVVLPFP